MSVSDCSDLHKLDPEAMEITLSHAEAWDDSALVEAWDDALKEYQKYHSIAAAKEDASESITSDNCSMPVQKPKEVTGEEKLKGDVEEVVEEQEVVEVEEMLREEEVDDFSAPANGAGKEQAGIITKEDNTAFSIEIADRSAGTVDDCDTEPTASSNPPVPQPQVRQEASFPFSQPHPNGLVHGFAIGGNDGPMRNLMMSWYWAGYYTGLRDGQQQSSIQHTEK